MALFLFLRRLFSAFYLITHPAVPLRLKLLPLLAFAYLVFPRDIFPDWIRGLGLIDDIIVMAILFGIFTNKAMKYVLADKRQKKNSIEVNFEVLGRVDEDADPGTAPEDDRPPKEDLRSR